jgi:hypothetical protein
VSRRLAAADDNSVEKENLERELVQLINVRLKKKSMLSLNFSLGSSCDYR